jgi:tetratricopeptide (TPR) repeat protein
MVPYKRVYFSLGYAYLKKGMLDESVTEFKRALTLNPNYAEFEYKRAVTIKPRYAEVHYNLDAVYQKKRKLDEVIDEFK